MKPLISICVPVYNMRNREFFLKRCLDSIRAQSYQNFEIVVTENGKMAENTNSAIRNAEGEIIKVLYMDDYLAHKDALKNIVENFKGDWMVTGCNHDPGTHTHIPVWNDELKYGKNTIGSPSVLVMRKGKEMYFDENLSWLLDCDLYSRLHEAYGPPDILEDINVTIGIHEGQHTHLMPEEEKLKEYEYMRRK